MRAHVRGHTPNPLSAAAGTAARQPALETAALHQGVHQQQANTSGPQPPPTHILTLPQHVIAAHILPHVRDPACVRAFLHSCKAAHSLSSFQLQADWLLEQRDPTTALLLAVNARRSRNESLLLALLNKLGALAATAEGPAGEPLLVHSSHAGFSLAVVRLLQLGADPNGRTGALTPLAAASYFGKISVVKVLLEAGADAGRASGADGSTALHDAAIHGEPSIVRVLLEAGAPVNARCEFDGNTPLHLACREDHADVVRTLLQHADIDTTVRNKAGDTPLDLGRRISSDETVALLEQHA